ncbi:hypothetical protein ACIRP0_03425 [Streptomyces sp. NPDC101733]|uniref:hypothetical protein n=1 Tax=unclassified Streptomyces TaxID=2593676 RepID=UPI00380EDECB
MRTAFGRRAVLAVSAASLTLLVTACGSGDAKEPAEGAGAGGPASAPAAAGGTGKPAAELTPLLVAQADLPGFKVAPDAGAALIAKGVVPKSDKPACQSLVQLQASAAVRTPSSGPAGAAWISVADKPKAPDANASAEEKLDAITGALSVTKTSVGLHSYDGKGAEDAFAGLKAAGAFCANGYTVTAEGENTKVEKVTAGAPVTAGDEALSYAVVADLGDGVKALTQIVAVRKGNTLATFSSLNLTGEAAQPKAVVEAQLKKLG